MELVTAVIMVDTEVIEIEGIITNCKKIALGVSIALDVNMVLHPFFFFPILFRNLNCVFI